MTINKSFLFLTLIALLSCKSSEDKNTDNLNLFSKCSDKTVRDNYKEVNNALFKIKYPDNWTEDHKLPSGLDISSNNFQDTLQRGFMLSVVPYQEMYLKKNPKIKYFKYINTTYNNFEAVFLTRNDLFARESDSTVYWRSELKIVNKAKSQIYFLVMGRRHNKNKEPEWCDFKEIVESLKIIE